MEYYRIEGGGHTWPGQLAPTILGYSTEDIDANEVMWAFFTEQGRAE